MRNLFIMHTQYNLIMATAVVQEYFKEEQNDLILIAEFPVTEPYIRQLEKIFSEVWVLQDCFDNAQNVRKLFSFIKKMAKLKSSNIINIAYDTVISAQEEYFDTLIVTKLKNKNRLLHWYAVEEDAYFAYNLNHCSQNYLRKILKKTYYCMLKVIYGRNDFYESINCYGMNRNIEKLFLSYPQYVRKELRGKTAAEICEEALIDATKTLYQYLYTNSCLLPLHSILFLSDLTDRYDNRAEIEKIVRLISIFSAKHELNFFIKYHPREDNKFEGLKNFRELPTLIPSEMVMAYNYGRGIVVIGNKSTSVYMAKKMGFKTWSIIRLQSGDGYRQCGVESFYNKIGIKCIGNIADVEKVLQKEVEQ